MGPSPITATVSSGLGSGLLESAHYARQRFHQGGVLIAHMLRDDVGVAFYDPRRNADILRIRTVIEEQIFAEVLQPALTEEALFARRGVGRHHALSNGDPADVFSNRDYIAGQFVPEHSGGHDHAGVIPAAKDFDVGPTGQGYFYPYENVAATDRWNGHRLYLQVLLAVEHGCHHLVIHYVTTSVAER